MPRYATAADHLSETELKQRYRDATDPIESRRYHLVWLVKKGWRLKEAAKVVGFNYDYAQEILNAYNLQGEVGLRNRLKDNQPPGAPPLLTPEQQQKLRERLNEPPDDGGMWTGPKVAEWIAQEIGREKVWPQRGWDYLKRLGFSWQRPRPRHTQGDPVAQEAFKQRSRDRFEQLQIENPEATVEFWAFDEHRLGLKPILKKVWSPVGERPIAMVNPRYEWLYVYGYVRPLTGATEWNLIPRVNQDWFEASLEDFAQAVGAGKDKIILLQVDQARWHTTEKLEVPEGIELILQPPYSPELQPSERLWSLVDEPLVNKAIESLERLEEILVERCCVLSQKFQEQIRRLTHFHWWPERAPALEGVE